MPDTVADPWERQTGEPPVAYAAFCHYRDMPRRSLRTAAHELKKYRTLVERWSFRHDWQARCAAYDADLDKLRREKNRRDIIAALEQHQRLATDWLTAQGIVTTAFLTKMQDPVEYAALVAHAGAVELYDMLVRSGASLLAVGKFHRLSLGLTTDSIELDTGAELALGMAEADQITKDPVQVDLMMQVLARRASLQSSPALPDITLPEVPVQPVPVVQVEPEFVPPAEPAVPILPPALPNNTHAVVSSGWWREDDRPSASNGDHGDGRDP